MVCVNRQLILTHDTTRIGNGVRTLKHSVLPEVWRAQARVQAGQSSQLLETIL